MISEIHGKQELSWLNPSRLMSKQTQFLLDLAVLTAAFALSYQLRFDFAIPAEEHIRVFIQLPYVVLIQLATLFFTGVYSFIWRYVGMGEVRTFVNAACLSCLPTLLIRVVAPVQLHPLRVPLSVILMDTILAFGGVVGLRVLRRAVFEWSKKRPKGNSRFGEDRKRVLLIGAGRAGMSAAKEILDRPSSDLEICGFVDDDPKKQGSVIQSVRVLGSTDELPRLVHEHDIDQVVISIATGTRRDFRRILDICESIPVKVRVIPGLYEILQGKIKTSRIRDLQIEDLLGREPIQLDEEQMEPFLMGRTVMVTGAGGSIGSELARQVARLRPANILLVERAEFALFDIDRELRKSWPELSVVPLVADVCDRVRMRSIFASYRPEVVLHAAAHKHVPMMEQNTTEAVRNNILGTRLLGELAGTFRVEVFVMISTDKAVRPTSVMGASKRVAELVVQDLDREFQTRYVAVRFGNVIGSAGSVIPIFREQILSGGPVTVTHPDMVRYFMTIPEASQLVLQAGAIGKGGEIFILDMGEPVRILDLAQDAITLSGLRPFEDIDIVFTGIRPGEKLFEELEIVEEQMARTCHPKIFVGRIAAYPEDAMRLALEKLKILASGANEMELRRFFNDFLPEARIEIDNGACVAVAPLASRARFG